MISQLQRRSRRSRRYARPDLTVEIQFLEGLLRRAPGYSEAVRILALNYTRRGNIRRALELNRRLQRLCPRDPMPAVNLACIRSVQGEFAQAASALELAIDRGFRDFSDWARNPYLNELRRRPEYRRVLIRILGTRLALL